MDNLYLAAPFMSPSLSHPPTPHLSPEVCMVVLSLCPSRAPPAAAVWPHPSTLEEESQSLITLTLSTLSKLYRSCLHVQEESSTYCRAQRSGARLGNRDVALGGDVIRWYLVAMLQFRPWESRMYVTVLALSGLPQV